MTTQYSVLETTEYRANNTSFFEGGLPAPLPVFRPCRVPKPIPTASLQAMATDAETVAVLTAQLAKQEKEFTAVKSKAISKIKQLNQRVQELEKQAASKGDDASASGASSEGDKDERFVKVESPGRGDALLRREEELRAREEAVSAREEALEKDTQALAEREQALVAAAARPSEAPSTPVDRATWHDELLLGLQGIHGSLKDACARSMH